MAGGAARALAALEGAYADPDAVVARLRGDGRRVVRTLGSDAPLSLIAAHGLTPVRLAADRIVPTPRADAVMGRTVLGQRGRLLLEQALDPAAADVPLLITRADAEQPQIFAALRELARLDGGRTRPIHLLDLLHIDRPSSRAYNHCRSDQLAIWLESLGGGPAGAAPAEAAEQPRLLRALAALRRADTARLGGTQMLRIIGAASILPVEEHVALMRAVLAGADALPALAGRRLYLTGSSHESDLFYRALEERGALVVGEDHPWGDPRVEDMSLPIAAMAAEHRAGRAIAAAAAARADLILHLTIDGDEVSPWDVAAFRRRIGGGLRFAMLRAPLDGGEAFRTALAEALDGGPPESRAEVPRVSPPRPAPAGQRSRKSLASVATFGAYQRDWFAGLRAAVAGGAPFAVVNANAPQEILRALDIPFVVNQWWASIVAAKQQGGRYRGLLRAHDYPTDSEAYSAQGLAAAFDDDAALAPWGGLPKPDFLHAITSTDPTARIFDEWARVTGADPYLYERTVDPRADLPIRWWEDLPDRWDEVLEPERLDLLVDEIRAVIARLEGATGRTLDQRRLVEVMDLVNEQEDYYRRTRDMIAAAVPAPIGIVDSMPATMVPQWHRGTVWARDAARAFHDEVAERIRSGAAAVPEERIRLMWVGRGAWSEMGFYQQWEASHGAVFVWSMYLALAADGYIRRFDRGRDPLRALAARFLTMGDELRMPTWAAPWHVHEARTHAIDGAVAAADADPFVLRALETAGIPVLALGVDNFAMDEADAAALAARVTAFIEGPAAERATRRAIA